MQTLVKSKDPHKTPIDMNSHYEELLNFFSILIAEPEKILILRCRYLQASGKSDKFNHRLRNKYIHVRKVLYESCDSDQSVLLPLVSAIKAKQCILNYYSI